MLWECCVLGGVDVDGVVSGWFSDCESDGF